MEFLPFELKTIIATHSDIETISTFLKTDKQTNVKLKNLYFEKLSNVVSIEQAVCTGQLGLVKWYYINFPELFHSRTEFISSSCYEYNNEHMTQWLLDNTNENESTKVYWACARRNDIKMLKFFEQLYHIRPDDNTIGTACEYGSITCIKYLNMKYPGLYHVLLQLEITIKRHRFEASKWIIKHMNWQEYTCLIHIKGIHYDQTFLVWFKRYCKKHNIPLK